MNNLRIREDTHKKGVLFSDRTTKGGERVNPPDLSNKTLFSLKSGCFSPKIWKKRKIWQNPFQAIIRLNKNKELAWTSKPLV